MSFHLCNYNAAALAAVANTDIPAIQDGYLPILNNHFVLPTSMMILKAHSGSATLQRTRLDSPTIRLYGNPHLRPVQQSLLPGSSPPVVWLNRRPFVLPAGEEIAVQATATGAGEHHNTQLWLFDGPPIAIDPGPIFAVRFTSTTAAVGSAWTLLTITLDQALPSGVYQMVFSELFSTTGIAHRWIFDQKTLRPGQMSQLSEFNAFNILSYQFPLGVMGRFTNTSLPRLEVLCDAADASHIGYIHLQKMGQNVTTLYPQGQPMLSMAG